MPGAGQEVLRLHAPAPGAGHPVRQPQQPGPHPPGHPGEFGGSPGPLPTGKGGERGPLPGPASPAHGGPVCPYPGPAQGGQGPAGTPGPPAVLPRTHAGQGLPGPPAAGEGPADPTSGGLPHPVRTVQHPAHLSLPVHPGPRGLSGDLAEDPGPGGCLPGQNPPPHPAAVGVPGGCTGLSSPGRGGHRPGPAGGLHRPGHRGHLSPAPPRRRLLRPAGPLDGGHPHPGPGPAQGRGPGAQEHDPGPHRPSRLRPSGRPLPVPGPGGAAAGQRGGGAMKAIVLDHLSKTYPGGKAALREVSIALDPGEIFGFLGPNGAGKTTTVKLLTGMLTPTGGGCTVLGRDPARQPEAVHALAGVVTEHAQMYDTLTGLENLTFFGALFGLDAKASKSRAQALLEALDLTHAAGQKLGAYSTGMRQRLSLARALMHRPQVLFLDEPTSGLDPQSAPGRPRPSSPPGPGGGYHLLPVHPPAALCPGNLHLLRPDGPGAALCPGHPGPAPGPGGRGRTPLLQAGGPPLPFPQTGPGRYEIPIAGEEDIPALVRQAVAAGGEITRVLPQAPTLEDLYFHLIGQREEALP